MESGNVIKAFIARIHGGALEKNITNAIDEIERDRKIYEETEVGDKEVASVSDAFNQNYYIRTILYK